MNGSRLVLLVLLVACTRPAPAPAPVRTPIGPRYHRVTAVDAKTGRGVPLVELETVHGVLYVTDSAGVAAIHESGLMGQEVWFHVRSHGYRVPADGFNNRGQRILLTSGGSTRIELERVNVAERLYRITGAGIYRDSVLLGDDVPLSEPLLNGGVLGQDSVQNAVFGGRLLWIWGDTGRASYPLGNFHASGAHSPLPPRLDPAQGVELTYWTGEDGFSRPMAPMKGPGPVWLGGLTVLRHEGREALLCYYARMKTLGEHHEHGIARWDPGDALWKKVSELPQDEAIHPRGHPIRRTEDGVDWIYFPDPYPSLRVRATWDAFVDPASYEAYTCLVAGGRWSDDDPPLDRGDDGALRWGWKPNTQPLQAKHWHKLIDQGLAEAEDGWQNLQDADGKPVLAHGGSLFWNAHRQAWVMIVLQGFGSSLLGEVWYAESKELLGPWTTAVKVVTHDDYSFYNVKQHPYFDQDGGRLIYFEGTYTATFSGAKRRTPRYDYNQIMYRLDLDDPRLAPARGA